MCDVEQPLNIYRSMLWASLCAALNFDRCMPAILLSSD